MNRNPVIQLSDGWAWLFGDDQSMSFLKKATKTKEIVWVVS